jgi:hypothetical protein
LKRPASCSGQVAKKKKDFTTRFWAGYITLFGSTLITHPLDTVRVRLSVSVSLQHTPTRLVTPRRCQVFPDTAKVGIIRAMRGMFVNEGFPAARTHPREPDPVFLTRRAVQASPPSTADSQRLSSALDLVEHWASAFLKH